MMGMLGMRAIPLGAAAIAIVALASCSGAKVETTRSYAGAQLPRPDHVLVSYFAVAPEQVKLDQGIAARIMRTVDDKPLNAQERKVAEEAQANLAQDLVDRLKSYGLPAQIGSAPYPGASNMLVHGQIVGIDQGNRTRRTLIGLGAGKSTVTADTQLFYATGTEAPRFLTSFEGSADSGRMPGAAETMGAGAVAQRAATSAALTGAAHAAGETRRASDTAESKSVADGLAKQIGQFAVSQGWITQSMVK